MTAASLPSFKRKIFSAAEVQAQLALITFGSNKKKTRRTTVSITCVGTL